MTWERCKRWLVLHPTAAISGLMFAGVLVPGAAVVVMPVAGLALAAVCLPLIAWAAYSLTIWRMRAGLKIERVDKGLGNSILIVMGLSFGFALFAALIGILVMSGSSADSPPGTVIAVSLMAAGTAALAATGTALVLAIPIGIGVVIAMQRVENKMSKGEWDIAPPLPEDAEE
jgi:hypothetical protein